MPIALLIGVPLVAVCYLLVNIAFFIVLSYEDILRAEAVALVSCLMLLHSVSTSTCPFDDRYHVQAPNNSQIMHNVGHVHVVYYC